MNGYHHLTEGTLYDIVKIPISNRDHYFDIKEG